MKSFVSRAVLEAGFIVFLFYSNLLMGEFERSGLGRTMGLGWTLRDIFGINQLDSHRICYAGAGMTGWRGYFCSL